MPQNLPDGRRLILASSSPFRGELLTRLRLPFEALAPEADETPVPGEDARTLAARLATTKARSVARRLSRSVVIGSDQVAVLDGRIIGKPGAHKQAHAQLSRASGKRVEFHTGVTVIDSDSRRTQVDVVTFSVQFRKLSGIQIERYLRREQPYQCAGSFKAEGLGIALFERLEGDDPNSLIGLPLIRLIRMLEAEGVDVL